jgi:hypothetical protein
VNQNRKELRYGLIALTALIMVLLTACTIYVRPGDVFVRGRLRIGIDLGDIITVFEPDRGSGATYFVGERISFRVRTRQDGYLTLTAIDPDGSVYVLMRNIFIDAGSSTTIPGRGDRFVFSLEPPRGLHRVRASFTSTETNTGSITYRGKRGEDLWTQTIITEIEPFPRNSRDVVETHFFLR